MHGLVGVPGTPGEACMASWGYPGPWPGQGHVLGSQAWPGSLEIGPKSPSGSAVSGSPPKLNAPEPRVS